MVRHHVVDNTPADDIYWELKVEDGRLRLMGSNGDGAHWNVLSIYANGVFYRHANIGITGLQLDDAGRITEHHKGG